MKICCIGILLLLLVGCASTSSYKDYLNDYKLFHTIPDLAELKGKEDYQKTLKSYKQYKTGYWAGYSCRGQAYCYKALGKERKALQKWKKAYRGGHRIDFSQMQQDSTFFAAIWPQLKKIYPSQRQKYLATLDTNLREKLRDMVARDQGIRYQYQDPKYASKKDSIKELWLQIDRQNIADLKEIVKQYGWPGISLTGDAYTTDIRGLEQMASLMVIHASEEVNQYFLPYAKQAARKNKTIWRDPEFIMTNLLWRFERKYGHVKLREVYLKKDGSLKKNKSFFQIGSLAKWLQDNDKDKVILFATAYSEQQAKANRKNIRSLEQIKQMLGELDIAPDRITINDTIKIVKDDGLGKYKVGLNYIRELFR